ncbi:MAG: desulfoferrodoxin [Bacteroidales bacterium]|jgi:superoxide reductase
MLKRKSVYKCGVCGNITEVLSVGGGTLACCGQPMNYLEESTADTSIEKHVPFIEKIKGGYLVKVGEKQDHPMLEAHYIIWIELLTSVGSYMKFLKPGDQPEAEFQVAASETIVGAREYCNIHGLWKG